MKKLFIVLAVASLGFVSCNNESDTEQKEKDSIEAKRVKDSADAADAAKMVPAGPTPAEIEAKRIQDSIRVADSLKNLKNKK
jgi:hypothetical protein